MTHPRTFGLADGCPFRAGDATFPGCARWERCVAATIPRGTWVIGYVPLLEVETAPAACHDFLDKPPVTRQTTIACVCRTG